jgi:hypothetical protein
MCNVYIKHVIDFLILEEVKGEAHKKTNAGLPTKAKHQFNNKSIDKLFAVRRDYGGNTERSERANEKCAVEGKYPVIFNG